MMTSSACAADWAGSLQRVNGWNVMPDTVPLRTVSAASTFDDVVYASPVLHAVLSRAEKVAPTDSTVLITGETGTGKELIARAIHKQSQRSGRPLVSINCAATPQALIASELFGHEKGAFTGALQRRVGRFEMAAGGTLFLDEVGELPLETQITLLRVLQEREFERVGGTATLHADVRVIAATNRDLETAIAAGTFRRDLYYRLNVFPIDVPPLRQRPADIRPLVEYFIDRCARKAGKTIRSISTRALQLLETHAWPGNVRELQNIIERSVIVCDSEVLSVDESWLHPPSARSARPTLRRIEPRPPAVVVPHPSAPPETFSFDEILRSAILRALAAANGVVGGPQGAAALLGMKRTTLQARMRKLGITMPKATDGLAKRVDALRVSPPGETPAF